MARFPMQRIAITAGYGPYTVSGVRKPHYGCDICSQTNGNVAACHAGRVVLSCYDSAGGNMIALQGEFNDKCDIITRYAHLASRRVRVGQTVAEGELIGVQGATGSACFGRHLHLEVWLVPKGYSYNYAGRIAYSVDPLSVLHVVDGQTFVVDDDTLYNNGIPYPEPKPADLEALPDGAKVVVHNGGVRVRMIPYIGYTPLVKGGGDRGNDTLAELFVAREFTVKYRCTTTTGGDTNKWALIATNLGDWWVALIEGYTELVGAPEVVVPSEPETPGEGGEEQTTAALREEIAVLTVRAAALEAQVTDARDQISRATDKISRAKDVLSE